jgi:hypothetical protein
MQVVTAIEVSQERQQFTQQHTSKQAQSSRRAATQVMPLVCQVMPEDLPGDASQEGRRTPDAMRCMGIPL